VGEQAADVYDNERCLKQSDAYDDERAARSRFFLDEDPDDRRADSGRERICGRE
jgi:hypothetical protein